MPPLLHNNLYTGWLLFSYVVCHQVALMPLYWTLFKTNIIFFLCIPIFVVQYLLKLPFLLLFFCIFSASNYTPSPTLIDFFLFSDHPRHHSTGCIFYFKAVSLHRLFFYATQTQTTQPCEVWQCHGQLL